MDFEKQLETQRKKASSALQTLLGYAGELATGDLESNSETLEQLKGFSLNMAGFFCVEGVEQDCDDRIKEKYVQPYERMLAGDKEVLSEVQHTISGDSMEVFMAAINNYKQEMQDDYHLVYDEDLSLCDTIMEDVAKQYGYEIAGCQQMMAGGEAESVQRNGTVIVRDKENTDDVVLEQNGPVMQGM